MNNEQKALIAVGMGVAGLIAWQLIRKGRVAKNLNFAIKGIDIDWKKKVASVDIRLINPTKTPITVNSIVCDLLVQGEAIGTVRYLKDTIIAGQAETILRLPVTVNPVSIASLLITILASKSKTVETRVKGVVGSEGLLIPIDITYSYDISAINTLAQTFKKKSTVG